MPRRQRFKPSRKPKPAIEQTEAEIIQPTKVEPPATEQMANEQMQPPDDRPQQT